MEKILGLVILWSLAVTAGLSQAEPGSVVGSWDFVTYRCADQSSPDLTIQAFLERQFKSSQFILTRDRHIAFVVKGLTCKLSSSGVYEQTLTALNFELTPSLNDNCPDRNRVRGTYLYKYQMQGDELVLVHDAGNWDNQFCGPGVGVEQVFKKSARQSGLDVCVYAVTSKRLLANAEAKALCQGVSFAQAYCMRSILLLGISRDLTATRFLCEDVSEDQARCMGRMLSKGNIDAPTAKAACPL